MFLVLKSMFVGTTWRTLLAFISLQSICVISFSGVDKYSKIVYVFWSQAMNLQHDRFVFTSEDHPCTIKHCKLHFDIFDAFLDDVERNIRFIEFTLMVKIFMSSAKMQKWECLGLCVKCYLRDQNRSSTNDTPINTSSFLGLLKIDCLWFFKKSNSISRRHPPTPILRLVPFLVKRLMIFSEKV